MVQVRFTNDTTPIEVTSETQETQINVTSETQVKDIGVRSSVHHDYLTGRDLENQHPISAITGLQDILNKLWTFIYEQAIASDTWEITHNLGKKPSVTVVDSAGNVQIPDEVTYNNQNQITITFVGAFAGKAFLN